MFFCQTVINKTNLILTEENVMMSYKMCIMTKLNFSMKHETMKLNKTIKVCFKLLAT